jgi:hypothetical protein
VRHALSVHAAVLARSADEVRSRDVLAMAEAWEGALFDRAVERSLGERAAVLGASGSDAVLGRARAAVEDDLAELVLAAKLPLCELDGGGKVVRSVRERLRDRLLTSVEDAIDSIKRRADERRPLSGAGEWREWLALTVAYDHAAKSGGEEVRRLAFVKVYPEATSYAVWLYNDRTERPLGNAIFRFLLAEATALDDARAVALMSKNVACGV